MNIKHILFFLLAILLISCKNEETEEKVLKLSITSGKKIKLGNQSIPYSTNISIEKVGLQQLLIMLNPGLNSISMYDFHTGKHEIDIKFKLQRDKKAVKIDGVKFINYDSIFLYNYSKGVIFLANYEGVIKDSFLIGKKALRDTINSKYYFYPWPSVNTGRPISKIENHILIAGSVSGETIFDSGYNRPVFSLLNLTTKEIKYGLTYPANYQRNNYGGYEYRHIYYTISGDNAYFSFPATDTILQYDLKNSIIKKISIGDEFNPKAKMLKNTKGLCPNDKLLNQIFYTSDSYKEIIWDPYRNIFYRFYELALSKSELNKYGQGLKKFKIQIFDSNFKHLGTTDKISDNSSSIFFVGTEGLYLLNTKKSNDNEAYFDCFSYNA
ncbi:MAG: DUF4221 family protein [Lacibacter sp.]|jgi:hypothetical protein